MILSDLFETASLPLVKNQLPRMRGSYGAFIISLRPQDFLALTTTDADELRYITDQPFPYDAERYRKDYGRDEGFGRYEMPFLKVRFPSGRVFGHEGRHRTAMVLASGGKSVPVTIYPYAENEYEVHITYYDEESNRLEREWGPFVSKDEADKCLSEELAKLEQADLYIARSSVRTLDGVTLKGQPDRSDGWDKAAWKIEDFPKQLVGQFDPAVKITNFRVGLVKGYQHHRR